MSLATAIKSGDVAELPSRRDEDWRWTDLRGLVRTIPERSKTYVGNLAPGPFDAVAQDSVAIVNGEIRTALTVASGGTYVLAARLIGAPGATAHTAAPTLAIENGHLILLESHEGDGEYLSDTDLTLTIGKDGSMERIVLADQGPDTVSVARCTVNLAPGASFSQTVITSGAKRQRIETHVNHGGAGSVVRLDGLYVLDDRRHADITTVVTHSAVGGTTNQLVKGRVDGQARGVFQGRIVVAEGADQTDARMGHHALILSDRAEVDAKPELEIYADDVACAHGNTVGALDEDALFYAQSRGIPEGEARALLSEAFLGEVVDRIEHDGAREIVRAWLAERLGGQA